MSFAFGPCPYGIHPFGCVSEKHHGILDTSAQQEYTASMTETETPDEVDPETCPHPYTNDYGSGWECIRCGAPGQPMFGSAERPIPRTEPDDIPAYLLDRHAARKAALTAKDVQEQVVKGTNTYSIERAGYVMANEAFDAVCAENARLRQALQDAGVPAGLVDAIAKGTP